MQQLIQSLVSHDPLEIILIYWLGDQQTFLIIINIKNSCAAKFCFVETMILKRNYWKINFWINSTQNIYHKK